MNTDHMSQDFSEETHTRIDLAGSLASMLCAIHCASAAFVPAALGALGMGALLGHEVEWVFTIVAIGLAVTAAFVGWRRHRSTLIVSLLGLGIVGLLASRAIEMSSGHDHGHGHEVTQAHAGGHHDEHEGEQAHGHHDHGEEGHGDGHGDEHGEGGFDTHLLGTLVGILAGLLLVSGHVAGLRANRRPR